MHTRLSGPEAAAPLHLLMLPRPRRSLLHPEPFRPRHSRTCPIFPAFLYSVAPEPRRADHSEPCCVIATRSVRFRHGCCLLGTSVSVSLVGAGRITGPISSEFTVGTAGITAKDRGNRYRRLLKNLHSLACVRGRWRECYRANCQASCPAFTDAPPDTDSSARQVEWNPVTSLYQRASDIHVGTIASVWLFSCCG